MVAFGMGEIFGCFFIGFLVDKYGSKIAGLFNLVIIVIMTGISLGFIY